MSSSLEPSNAGIYFFLEEESEGGPKSIRGPFLNTNGDFSKPIIKPVDATGAPIWPRTIKRTYEDALYVIADAIRKSDTQICDIYTVRELEIAQGAHRLSEGCDIVDWMQDFAISPGMHVSLGKSSKSYLDEDDALSDARSMLPNEKGAGEEFDDYLRGTQQPKLPVVKNDKAKRYQWDVMFGVITRKDQSTKEWELKRLVTVTKVRVKGEERKYPSTIVRELV
ncbi:hypothetical protein FB567DRAFT_591510 [Paraphoma chrysanthemicola]|uniref:Uncharacterized protein n=1 Tax=Paraphoma chrysanthemicola TaxID=798071 RepID=A0A8K0VZH9_9PLEO|nr:hypothetical protein FB567DRAFT_591510 [Paraphoma chrysanthemicola]